MLALWTRHHGGVSDVAETYLLLRNRVPHSVSYKQWLGSHNITRKNDDSASGIEGAFKVALVLSRVPSYRWSLFVGNPD